MFRSPGYKLELFQSVQLVGKSTGRDDRSESRRDAVGRRGLFPLAAMRHKRVKWVEYVHGCVLACVQGESVRRVLSRIDRRRLFRGQVAGDRPRFERSPSRIIDTAAKCQPGPMRRTRSYIARILEYISYHFEYLIAEWSKCRIIGTDLQRDSTEFAGDGLSSRVSIHTRDDRHEPPSKRRIRRFCHVRLTGRSRWIDKSPPDPTARN